MAHHTRRTGSKCLPVRTLREFEPESNVRPSIKWNTAWWETLDSVPSEFYFLLKCGYAWEEMMGAHTCQQEMSSSRNPFAGWSSGFSGTVLRYFTRDTFSCSLTGQDEAVQYPFTRLASSVSVQRLRTLSVGPGPLLSDSASLCQQHIPASVFCSR